MPMDGSFHGTSLPSRAMVRVDMQDSRTHLGRLVVLLLAIVLLPAAAGAGLGDAQALRAAPPPLPAVLGMAMLATARLTREAALRDPVLKTLKEVVETSRCGVTAGEAASLASARMGVELDRKTAEFHLSQLTRLRILRRHKVDMRRLYLAFDAPEPPLPEPLPSRILALVRAHPGVSASQAAALLGVTDTRFDRHLKALMEEGLVSRWRPHGAQGFLLQCMADPHDSAALAGFR